MTGMLPAALERDAAAFEWASLLPRQGDSEAQRRLKRLQLETALRVGRALKNLLIVPKPQSVCGRCLAASAAAACCCSCSCTLTRRYYLNPCRSRRHICMLHPVRRHN